MDAYSSVTALCCIGVAWQYIVYSVLAPVVPAFQAHEIWPFHTGRWPVSESIRCGCGAPALVWRPPPPPRAGEAIGPAVVGVELVVEEAPEPPPPLLLFLLLLLAAAAVAIAACCCAIRSRCLHNERRWKKPEKRKRIRYAVQNPQLFLSHNSSKQRKKRRKRKKGKRTGSSTLAAAGSASPPVPASSARAGPSSGSIPDAPRLWLASRVGSAATVVPPNADTVVVVVVVDLRRLKVEVGVRAAWQ